MNLTVVGAGYVGLVTAACLAHLGHHVVCLDIDVARVENLRCRRLPIWEPGLDELVDEGLAAGRLSFEWDPSTSHGSSLVIVAVGTLDADGEWTDRQVRAAVCAIAADHLAPRAIVIRSTLLPGTALNIAQEATAIDARVEIALNPEFTREASAVNDFLAPDRIVVGVRDPASGSGLPDALRRVFAPLEASILVTDLTSAETIKLASNVYLAAKITFANELARLCAATGADVAAVVDGMGLDRRIVRAYLSPGPGFGGSCLPAQARALPELARRYGVHTPLMDAIWPSNEQQAGWLVDRLEKIAGRSVQGMRIALLGVAFKAGTDDLRESPALRIGAHLLERGADLAVFDPHAREAGATWLAMAGATVEAAASPEEACAGADAVVLATEWPEFRLLDWATLAMSMRGPLVVDARHVVDVEAATAAGLQVMVLGVQVGR